MKVKAILGLYPHQMQYVTGKHKHEAIIAGYGSGKTYSNVMRTLYLLELRKGKAYIFYCAPTYDIVSSTYYPLLIETLELLNIRYHEDKAHRLILIDTPELKGTIKLISLENFKYLVGFTATDGILDEFDVLPQSRQKPIWVRALARLRGCQDATLSITTTPEGHKYTYELYKSKKIHQITASTTDNKSLPESFVEDLMDSYDDAHVAMYINGQYVNLNGLRAMYNYDERQLIDPIDISQIPININVGMDFNVDPFCLSVSYMTEDGKKITFDEMFIHNAQGCNGYASFTDKTALLLLQRYPNLWYQQHIDPSVPKVYNIEIRPDMTGNSRETQSNTTDINILKKYGFSIRGKSNPPASSRLKIANIALQKGLWLVTKNCENLIRDMEMCVTDEYGELKKKNIDKDRTHMLDATTYDVFQTFQELIYRKPSKREI